MLAGRALSVINLSTTDIGAILVDGSCLNFEWFASKIISLLEVIMAFFTSTKSIFECDNPESRLMLFVVRNNLLA